MTGWVWPLCCLGHPRQGLCLAARKWEEAGGEGSADEGAVSFPRAVFPWLCSPTKRELFSRPTDWLVISCCPLWILCCLILHVCTCCILIFCPCWGWGGSCFSSQSLFSVLKDVACLMPLSSWAITVQENQKAEGNTQPACLYKHFYR